MKRLMILVLFCMIFSNALLASAISYAEEVIDNNLNSNQVEQQDQDIISINVEEANLIEVIKLLLLDRGVNIIVHPAVKGTVNFLYLEKVEWRTALDVLGEIHGFEWEEKDNFLKIFPRGVLGKDQIKNEEDKIQLGEEETSPTKDKSSYFFKINEEKYRSIEELKKELFSSDGQTWSIINQGTISILGELHPLKARTAEAVLLVSGYDDKYLVYYRDPEGSIYKVTEGKKGGKDLWKKSEAGTWRKSKAYEAKNKDAMLVVFMPFP